MYALASYRGRLAARVAVRLGNDLDEGPVEVVRRFRSRSGRWTRSIGRSFATFASSLNTFQASNKPVTTFERHTYHDTLALTRAIAHHAPRSNQLFPPRSRHRFPACPLLPGLTRPFSPGPSRSIRSASWSIRWLVDWLGGGDFLQMPGNGGSDRSRPNSLSSLNFPTFTELMCM
jgi:hypothetical protein